MTTFKLFVAACLCAAAFTACSNEKNDTPGPGPTPAPKEDFSLTAPDGKPYTNGQTVTISSVDASGTMRLEFGVKNNTKELLELTMEQKILDSDYDKIANHAAFCWDACYSQLPLEEGFTAIQIAPAGGSPLGAPSGDMLNIEPTTPSFEAKVEYTITNTANSEKRTLVGHYKYTKE